MAIERKQRPLSTTAASFNLVALAALGLSVGGLCGCGSDASGTEGTGDAGVDGASQDGSADADGSGSDAANPDGSGPDAVGSDADEPDAPVSDSDSPDTGPSEPTVILPRTSILADEVAILVNDADPQSVEVAAYYQAARGIPDGNVIHLDFTQVVNLDPAGFAPLKNEVDNAVSTDIQAFAISWTTPYRVGCMSVASAFALGFDDKYCNTTGGSCGITAQVDYFDSDSKRPFTDHGVRPTMILAAANVDNAKALIDRGVAADDTFPTGDGYLVRTTDVARSARWSNFVATVADWDYPNGLQLEYLDNSDGSGSNVIANTNDVLFYFTGLANVPEIATNTYLPGAVADHLTSFGGRIPTSGQMSVVKWLEAGATASYGTVVEPCAYTQKFPDTRVMLPHYFRGETVLEAYWKSVHWPGEGNFVGEPLAKPWGAADIGFDAASTTLTIKTTLMDPEKSYELREADDSSGPWTTVLANITVAKHERATITYEPATAKFYELVELP